MTQERFEELAKLAGNKLEDFEAVKKAYEEGKAEYAKHLRVLAEAVLSVGNIQKNGIAHGIDPLEYAATIAPMARAALDKL